VRVGRPLQGLVHVRRTRVRRGQRRPDGVGGGGGADRRGRGGRGGGGDGGGRRRVDRRGIHRGRLDVDRRRGDHDGGVVVGAVVRAVVAVIAVVVRPVVHRPGDADADA